MDSNALPEISSLSALTINKSVLLKNTLPNFSMTSSNYWEPVDMMTAMGKEMPTSQNLTDRELKQFGLSNFSLSKKQSNFSSSTKVTNSVYQDARIFDTCPPFGVCARCAPYKRRTRF